MSAYLQILRAPDALKVGRRGHSGTRQPPESAAPQGSGVGRPHTYPYGARIVWYEAGTKSALINSAFALTSRQA
eukprot:5217852-Pleurochrysis_carterae.AAC.5